MDGLTDKQKRILWIEALEKDIEIVCKAIESGRPTGEQLGRLHAVIARCDGRRTEYLMEDALEQAEQREIEEIMG